MQVTRKSASRVSHHAILAAVAGVSLCSQLAMATSYTWTRAQNSNNWDSITAGTSNWVTTAGAGTVPPQVAAGGDTTDIVYSGTAATATTSSSMRQDYTINSLTFASDFVGSGASTVSVTTPSTLLAGATSAHLTIGAGGIDSEVGNGTVSFNLAITKNAAIANADLILGADQTWKINAPVPPVGGSAITFSIARNIVGDKLVTKTGTGVLVLSQTTANTNWTGGLNLVEGSIRTGGATGAHSGHFGTGSITSTSNNDVSITASTVNSAGGDRLFDNDLFLGGTGQLTFGGSFNLGFTANSTWTLQGDKKIGASFITQHDGNITGNFGWSKQNSGVVVLTAANDYTGVTNVNDGVLQPKNALALGTTAGGTVVNVGGALELQNGINIAGESLSLAGMGEATASATLNVQANAGALRNRNGANVWSGPVAIQDAGALIAVDADSLDLSGGVTGSGTATAQVSGAGLLKVKHARIGGLQMAAGSRVAVNAGGGDAGTSVVDRLDITPTAVLDIADHALAVNYGDLDPSPLTAIKAQILTGRGTGNWAGLGITSSSAAANSTTFGIGYGESSAILGGAGGTFGSQAVDGTAVLVRYTRLGDADLNGSVALGDFTRLAAGFGGAGDWSNGDFNYDGLVTLADFTTLAANFGLSADLPRSAVPEPTALGLVAAAGLCAVRRRR